MNPLRLLIVDDSEEIIAMLLAYVRATDGFEVVGVATDTKGGLALAKTHALDAIIIDLVMPGQDGFSFLEDLKRHVGQGPKPVCIMISGMSAPHILTRAAELGADHFVLKPFDIDLLFKRIEEICRMRSRTAFESVPVARKAEDFVQGVLDSLPISHALMGYRYIKTAIRLSIEEPRMLEGGVTKMLYPEVARRHKTTPARVERAIRHAILTVWEKGGGVRFSEMMGFPDGKKPTNSHFIAAIADRYLHYYPGANGQGS